jgi:hypothetical protein
MAGLGFNVLKHLKKQIALASKRSRYGGIKKFKG